ncbi:MAG TPA: VanZ family protein [Acidobacteriaceae bacterium]|nr:VanZ family protein [Acidobacteriaceae bacterium]
MSSSAMGSTMAAPPAPARHGFGHIARAWIPVLVCVLVIAVESTIYFGADHTSGPLQRLLEFLLHRHFTHPEWWRLHIIIRKCGHFTGYGLLSASWFRAFWMSWPIGDILSRRRFSTHGLAMLGTLFVASCDEFHQHFLSNRNGSVIDVMVDCSGGLAVQLFIWLWMRRRFRD